MARVANTIAVHHPGVGVPGEIVIDGEVFPYYLDERGPRIEHLEPDADGGMPAADHVVWLPVLAETVTEEHA